MTTLLIVLVLVVIVAVLVMKFLPRMRGQAVSRRHGVDHGTRGAVAGAPATYDPATPLEDRHPEDNRV